MLGIFFYEHLYCTDSDILSFLFLLTNVLIVSQFGLKRLPNALKVNVNVLSHTPCAFDKVYACSMSEELGAKGRISKWLLDCFGSKNKATSKTSRLPEQVSEKVNATLRKLWIK